jgi:MFS family permease
MALVARSILVAMACGAPLALVGSMGPAVVRDLDLSASAFGVAASAFFVATMVTAYPAGRWIDRVGWQAGLRIASMVAAGGLVVGAFAGGQAGLAATMALGGAALGVAMPACVRAMTDGAPPNRLGTHLGLLHAAIPTAIMVAGAVVATLSLSDSWRAAFAVTAVAAALLAALPVRNGGDGDHATGEVADTSSGQGSGGLRYMFVAVVLASVAAGVLVTSFVVSTTALGVAAGVAASVLAVGTFTSVVVRVAGGWLADRANSAGAVPAGLLLLAGGIGALLVAGGTGLLLFGAALTLGAGLGWPGLLYSAVARRSQGRTGTAIGLIELGSSGGAALGPTLFGMLLDGRGPSAGWYFVAACLLVAGGCSILGDRAAVGKDTRIPRLRPA